MFTVIYSYIATVAIGAGLFLAMSARMTHQRPDSATTHPPVVDLKKAA
ncbi:MAG: hypothetical protein OEW11_05435 [Nitrospirota bacterium]|nr:hypothetical protein [Nitrospirota bacterium]